jgi:hypothetical protein
VPGRSVSSIAAQLVAALPAYRAAIEAEEAAGMRQLLEATDNDPIPASEDIHKPLSEPMLAYRSGLWLIEPSFAGFSSDFVE